MVTKKQLMPIAVGVAIALIAVIVISGVLALTVFSSSIHAPAGQPTPTLDFIVTATVNGVAQADPTNIQLPAGYIGAVDTIVYTITSNANQAITVTASQGTPLSVSLPTSGSTGQITVAVTLTDVVQTVNVSFSASHP